MKIPRRRFLHLAAGAAALPALASIASALDYPTRPVRIIVGYPPGGIGDILARLFGQRLSERFGQPFVVENRPGAGSNIGAEIVVHAPPDGHTLLLASSARAINVALYPKLRFNFMRDIAPVAAIDRGPLAMVVNPSFPAKTVPEFIAYAKANPAKINMASAGIGGITHVAGELLKITAGIEMVHVPFRGDAPAITALLGEQVQVYFGTIGALIEQIRTGRLRALAVTTATRSEALPEIATVAEFLPDYEASQWNGIGAPRNTPPEVIDKLNTEINSALADSKVKARLADLGYTVLPGSPADFGKLIVVDTGKWARVIKTANIKPE